MPATLSRTLAALSLLPVLALAACNQADYAVDVINHTPQPVHAQLFRRGDGNQAVLSSYRRLGPGDRAFIGPVRNNTKQGAFVAVDSLGGPVRPLTVELHPGQSFYELLQDGEGQNAQFHLIEKPAPR